MSESITEFAKETVLRAEAEIQAVGERGSYESEKKVQAIVYSTWPVVSAYFHFLETQKKPPPRA